MAVRSLDYLSLDTSQAEVKVFLVSCVDLLQKLAVSTAQKSDIITRTLDSLFVLARTALNVQDPRTYVPAFEYLGGAVPILDSALQDADVDHANSMRRISETYYNIAESLYQVTRYGAAVQCWQCHMFACVLHKCHETWLASVQFQCGITQIITGHGHA